jgi:hypothetical protein
MKFGSRAGSFRIGEVSYQHIDHESSASADGARLWSNSTRPRLGVEKREASNVGGLKYRKLFLLASTFV